MNLAIALFISQGFCQSSVENVMLASNMKSTVNFSCVCLLICLAVCCELTFHFFVTSGTLLTQGVCWFSETMYILPKRKAETFLVVQGLRLHDPNAGGLGSNPDQGTRSHTLQLKTPNAAMKIPRAATETHHRPITMFKINIF